MQNYLCHCSREAKHSASLNASFHSVPLAMTNVQLILPKYLIGLGSKFNLMYLEKLRLMCNHYNQRLVRLKLLTVVRHREVVGYYQKTDIYNRE